MAELDTLLVKLEAETAGLRRDLARAGQSVDRFGNNAQRGLNTFQRGMRDAQRQAMRFAAGVAASLAGLFTAQAINGVVNYSAQLENLSRRLGFTSERIQELRFAASDFGIESNQVDLALQRFTRRLGQAATTGDGELLPVLQRLGIAFRDEATGAPRDAMEVLLDYADAVQDMGSQSDRLVAAFKAFDSEGAALVTVLQQGREGIQNYASAAHELGVVIDNETTARARELRRELDIIGQRMRMEFTQTVLDNASAMEDLATAAGDAVTMLGQVVQILQWSGDALGSVWVDMFGLDVVGARDPVAEAEAVRDVLDDLYAGATTTASAFDRLAASIGEVRARELFAESDVQVPRAGSAAGSVLGMSSADLMRPSTEEATRLAESLSDAADELDRLGELYSTLPDQPQGDAVQYFMDLAAAITDVNEESGRRVFTTETESDANERLAASFRSLNEAMAARSARATELAAGSITPLMAFRSALDEIRALTASGDLQAAAITIGVDIDRVRLNAVLAAYRDFIADGGEAAEAAEALQAALDGLQVSDSVIAAISDLPQKLKDSAEAARTLGTEIADSIAGSIGDAILKAESLRDVLQSVAQDIARILVQRFVTNPLADFLGNMVSGGLGGLGGGAGTSIGTDGGSIISTGIKASGSQMRTAMAGAAGAQSMTVSMPVTINADGADPEGLRRLREQVQQLQDEAPAQFASIMRERQRRSGSVGV